MGDGPVNQVAAIGMGGGCHTIFSSALCAFFCGAIFPQFFFLWILDFMVPILLCCSCLEWGSICDHMLLAFLVPTPLLGQTSYERLLRKFDV